MCIVSNRLDEVLPFIRGTILRADFMIRIAVGNNAFSKSLNTFLLFYRERVWGNLFHHFVKVKLLGPI